jgi:hypothetical protein
MLIVKSSTIFSESNIEEFVKITTHSVDLYKNWRTIDDF